MRFVKEPTREVLRWSWIRRLHLSYAFDEELTWSFFRWFSRDTGSSCYTIPYGGIDLTFGCYTIAIQYNLELTALILVPGQCHFPTIDRLLLRQLALCQCSLESFQRSFNFSSALIYCFTVLAHESPFLWRELYTKFVCLFCNNLHFFFRCDFGRLVMEITVIEAKKKFDLIISYSRSPLQDYNTMLLCRQTLYEIVFRMNKDPLRFSG